MIVWLSAAVKFCSCSCGVEGDCDGTCAGGDDDDEEGVGLRFGV